MKARLPQIAIALAVIAVAVVALAVYVVTTRDDTQAAVTPPSDARSAPQPLDASMGAPPAVPTDAAPFDRPSRTGCTPCGQCKPTECKCNDGTWVSSMRCLNGCCVPPDKTCPEACKGHGGTP